MWMILFTDIHLAPPPPPPYMRGISNNTTPTTPTDVLTPHSASAPEKIASPNRGRHIPIRGSDSGHGRTGDSTTLDSSLFKSMSLPVQRSNFPTSLAPVELQSASASVGSDFADSLLDLGLPSPDKFPSISSFPDFDAGEPSPWLSDLVPSSADNNRIGLGQVPFSFGATEQATPSATVPIPTPDDFEFSGLLDAEPEEAEEIVKRQQDNEQAQKSMALSIPEWGVSAQWNMNNSNRRNSGSNIWSVPRNPDLGIGSPEMLVMRFDKITCGILSVKDGAGENPWRTLIWPMARDTPALQHAVFSLAAFHSSKENPAFRVHGVDHMRRSIACMVQGIQNMRADAALATSLALAFADTWDQHTRTCIQHLRGAKALVAQVLQDGTNEQTAIVPRAGTEDNSLSRVRFLYNTWLYMDVIARLTSLDECGSHIFDIPMFDVQDNEVHEIDPLMGCATTLFPLIDRAVRLIQRVRKSQSNSISLVSQAIELKVLIERWEPPEFFEPPEDPTSEVMHGVQTAQAYRWATLLYLHQAVPEMPSEAESELAKRVLILLATVPLRSRTNIVHMFPLLVAGCEADQEEDREWVVERWAAIQARLMLGTAHRCLEVVREVWARRDAYEAEKKRREMRPGGTVDSLSKGRLGSNNVPGSLRKGSVGEQGGSSVVRRSSTASSLGNIEFEKTVRGRLHWVNVMREWEWEGMYLVILFDHDHLLIRTQFFWDRCSARGTRGKEKFCTIHWRVLT